MNKILFMIFGLLSVQSNAKMIDVTNRLTSLHCYIDKWIGIPEDSVQLQRINGRPGRPGQLGIAFVPSEWTAKDIFRPISHVLYDSVKNNYIVYTDKTSKYVILEFDANSGKGGYYPNPDRDGSALVACSAQGDW